MAIIKYAAITTDNLSVGLVGFFDTAQGSFSDFQTSYHTMQVNQQIIDITGSRFPEGQGWEQNSSGFRPVDGIFRGVAEVKTNISAQVLATTDTLEFTGSVTWKGKPFPRTHDVRDDVVLLANSVSLSPAMAAALLPLRVNSLDFSEAVISTVSDAQDFALAMLTPLKALYAGQADQLAAVQAMTTITELCQYVDPR